MAGGDPADLCISSEAITCSICYDHFDNPKTLPCGHSLCLSPCLVSLSRDRPMLCPLCRNEITLPPSSRIEDLPTNYVVMHLLDTAKPTPVFDEDVKELKEDHEGISSLISKVSGNICSSHDEFCDFFCNTCITVACSKCLLSIHKVGHHNIILATEFAREKIDSLLLILKDLEKIDLERYKDDGFSMKMLRQAGQYYKKMPKFQESLDEVERHLKMTEILANTIVEDLLQQDFERVKEMKDVSDMVLKIKQDYTKVGKLYNEIKRDVKNIKRAGFVAAAAIGFSFGIPLLPL